jgi:lactoylglutathione lyase
MKIEHIAVWSKDIEATRRFYVEQFGCTHGVRYENPAKGFSSYFLSFGSGARLEIMQVRDLPDRAAGQRVGLAHFAIAVGSEAAVRAKTQQLKQSGVRVIGEPRWTGDGCFESIVLDPDGNAIEITI